MANRLPLTVNLMAEKSGFPAIAAISGVSRSLVKADTTEAKAAPITTPTAISITLPRRMNCLNPLSLNTSCERWAQLYGEGAGSGKAVCDLADLTSDTLDVN